VHLRQLHRLAQALGGGGGEDVKYTPRYIATRAAALRVGLQLSNAEWRCVQAAAKDCHLGTAEYVRLMVLAAAGMGGAAEHLERAIDASWKADKP
jgi:hypothetical protein